MPEETPQVENPEILPDLFMMLELYDSSGAAIQDRVPCLVEVNDGISKRIRDLGITRKQPDPSNMTGCKEPDISEMAYASCWNFRSLAPLELNELFWPFQAQRNAEMIVAVEVDSLENITELTSGDIKSTGNTSLTATTRENLDTTASITCVWGKTNSDQEFTLDMYPLSISYFDDMAVIHLVDFRYFANKLSLRDCGVENDDDVDYSDSMTSASIRFGAEGKILLGRQLSNKIAPGDADSPTLEGQLIMDPSCYSMSAPVGVIADNEVLGSLNMPAFVPIFRKTATSLDLRDDLTNSATSALKSSAELMDDRSYTIKGEHKGKRIIAKNSAWPSGHLVPVGTGGDTSTYRQKVVTDVFWCEDGLVTGVERSDSIQKRGDDPYVDNPSNTAYNQIRGFVGAFGQKKIKTCLRLPLDSEELGGEGIDYNLTNSSLTDAATKLDAAMRCLTSFDNAVTNQSAADHFSGGLLFLNIEQNENLDSNPFDDLTYMALSNECAYIKFGVWNGGRDSMPIPGRPLNGDQTPDQGGEGDGGEGEPEANQVETTSPTTGPVLSAQCRLVPNCEDIFNYSVPVNFNLGSGSCKDNGSVKLVKGSCDEVSLTPLVTVSGFANPQTGFSDAIFDLPESAIKIKITHPLKDNPVLNGEVLAYRVLQNARVTRTGHWIVLEQDC